MSQWTRHGLIQTLKPHKKIDGKSPVEIRVALFPIARDDDQSLVKEGSNFGVPLIHPVPA